MGRARACIVVVGTELLRPGRADKNGPFLVAELHRLGFHVEHLAIVPDDAPSIAAEVRRVIERGIELLVVCGGLGPTTDDVTRQAVSEATGIPLEEDRGALAAIRTRAAAFGDTSEEMIRRQSLVFRGGRWFVNPVGVAPALVVARADSTIYLLPGPPREMQALFRDAVRQELLSLATPRPTVLLRTVGLREVDVGIVVEKVLKRHPGITISYLPAPGLVDLVLSSEGQSLDPAREAIRDALGGSIYTEGERSLEETVETILVQRGERVVAAESCTGGLVAELLTSVPGSSRCFLGGVVAYSNELKSQLLGVPRDIVGRHGAVSREVAEAMARGAHERLGADWALSLTGIAGPEGGSPDKPVGLVFCGLAGPDGRCMVERYLLGGDRSAIRLASARMALDLLRRQLGA